jgi:DNA-binding response OmpR family regulator
LTKFQHAVLSLYKLDLTGSAGSVRLTATEASLLIAFKQSADARLSFDQVAKSLGVVMNDAEKPKLQIRMVRLRKKLHEAGAEGAVIESIRNMGYQFFEELEIRKS